MLLSKRLILKGKRWRKFYEASILIIFIALALVTGCLVRIITVEYFEWQQLLFMGIPFLFIIWWLPYKRKELKFSEIITGSKKEENHEIVTRTLKKLDWYIKLNHLYFIEAFAGPKITTTWGNEMVSILIDENRISINCICNVDIFRNQAFFTFGRLKKKIFGF